MSRPSTDANLNVGITVNEQSLKAGEQRVVRTTQTIGKAADEADKKLNKVGKTAEATAGKVSKSLENINARTAGKVQVVNARTSGEAETARTRSIGRLAEQEAKTLTKVVEGEQRRATLITREESAKRLHIFRQEHRVQSQVSAGRGGRGGITGVIGRLLGGGGGGMAGSLLAGLAGGFGIGVGGYALARGVGAVVEATDQATAYDRQRIAAEKLAGSQEQLNRLMEAYAEASGGAVSTAVSLETVTRLLATGYAKNAPQLERFVRATRGASLSLGKPQENIAQETQLAISNTSVKRLDQIGLGIDEVAQRTEELRDANKSLTREMAFGEAVMSLMEEKYSALSNSVEGQATGVEKLRKAWADFFLTLGQNAQGPVNTVSGLLAKLLNAYTNPQGEGSGQSAPLTWAERMDRGFNRFVENQQDKYAQHLYGYDPSRIAAARALQRGTFTGSGMGTMGYVNGTVQSDPTGQEDIYQSMKDAAYGNILQVEKTANKARLNEIENYESQRESIINNYGKMIVREEEDFTRQRARSLRDYERSIMDVMRDAKDREKEMQEDLDRQIAESREDSNERLTDLQEQYNEDRERAEKDHRDAMLTATGQLDAIAVLEERKRFRKEQTERDKQHDKAVAEEKESLQERIDDAVEAHQERLEDAREADAKRLEDMRVDRARQLADEDEDRAIRLTRAAEDHQKQLNELDRQHEDRMNQIKEQAAEQTKEIEQALVDDLAEAGDYIRGMTEIMNERKKLQEEWFDSMIERMENDIEYNNRVKQYNESGHDPRFNPEEVIPGFARGGVVANTGLAYVHAGERIIPAGATNNYAGGNNLVIEDGAFRISTTPGMEMAVGQSIEDILINLLERV